jgi:hypothetical protein
MSVSNKYYDKIKNDYLKNTNFPYPEKITKLIIPYQELRIIKSKKLEIDEILDNLFSTYLDLKIVCDCRENRNTEDVLKSVLTNTENLILIYMEKNE